MRTTMRRFTHPKRGISRLRKKKKRVNKPLQKQTDNSYTRLFHSFPHSIPCSPQLNDNIIFRRQRGRDCRWLLECRCRLRTGEISLYIYTLDAPVLPASWGTQRNLHPPLPRKLAHRGQRTYTSLL